MFSSAKWGMCRGLAALLVGGLLFVVLPSSGFTAEAASPVERCLDLASDPADPFHWGQGVKARDLDIETALDVCTEAFEIEKNNCRVAMNLGRVYFYKRDYKQSSKFLEISTGGQCHHAHYLTGEYYQYDDFPKYSFFEFDRINAALKYYEKAAEYGHLDAKITMAILLLQGSDADEYGEAKNILLSLPMNDENAHFNRSLAMYVYGYAYMLGKGFEQDMVKAKYWYQESIILGNPMSMVALAGLLETANSLMDGKKKNSSETKKTIFNLYKRAAELDYLYAQVIMAKVYKNGRLIKRDLEKSEYWLQKARENGYKG